MKLQMHMHHDQVPPHPNLTLPPVPPFCRCKLPTINAGRGRGLPPPPTLAWGLPCWGQQTHHYIEEFIELVMNARMGFAINHTSILPWVDELLQNTAITCALLTSQG